jgi:hypothetical protein
VKVIRNQSGPTTFLPLRKIDGQNICKNELEYTFCIKLSLHSNKLLKLVFGVHLDKKKNKDMA